MADFHAADLWVAVIPDTKQVGPAMEKAGKEAKDKFGSGVKDFGKTILDDLQHAGASIGDTFKKVGKTAGGQFTDEFKKGAKDVGKVLLEEFGPVLGEELGKAIGGLVGDALHDIPGMDTAVKIMRDVADAAAPARDALQGMANAAQGIRDKNLPGALSGMSDALSGAEKAAGHMGADISGWTGPLQDSLGKVSTIAGDITGMSGDIKTFGSTVEGVSPGIAAAVNTWAGPIALAAAAMKEFSEYTDPTGKGKPAHDYLKQHGFLPGETPGGPPGAGQPSAGPGQVVKPPEPGQETPTERFKHFFGFQGGGPINGPGAIGKDSVLMLGAPGEHMVPADEVDAAGGHNAMYGIRAMMRAGMFRDMKGYDGGGAPGGDVGPGGGANLANLYRYATSLVGVPYSQATRNDCSGMVSKLVNVALGLPPAASFTTQSEQSYLLSHGFIMGNGPPGSFRVGWYNHGSGADDGHTAATLPDGTHAESGGAHGAFLLGSGAAGAENSEFDMHAYLPMNPQGDAISGAGAGRGGGGGGSGLGGGGAGGGGLAGGGGGGGGSASEQGQQFGAGLVGGVLQATGLDGSVFKSFTGKGPMDWGITKLAGGLIGELTKTSTKPGGAGPPGAGGILGGLIGSLPGGEAISALATAAGPGGAAGGAAGGTTNIDNSFTVNGVGSVPEQKQAANAYQAQVAAAPVNP